MATSAFKSTSRRGAAAESKGPPLTTASRRRSHSVSAVSRKIRTSIDDNTLISTEFSNSRDNPLFWSTSSSPDKEESGKISEIANCNGKLSNSLNARNSRSGSGGGNTSSEQRGRSVRRSCSEKNGIGRSNNGIGRSLSRVRGRSVSKGPYNGAYESEKEQDVVAFTTAQSMNETKRVGNGITRANSVRNRVDKTGHAKNGGVRMNRNHQNQATEWSEDDSACSLQLSNLEDGISVGSLSEAEDKMVKAAIEELNVFQRNNVNTVTATNIADLSTDLVNPEVISDIRRECARKLEESEERARKLREDLFIEEQRGQELDRILKEILPSPEASDVQRARRGRRTSNERKRMSKRLAEEAMAYFDECVSLSPFDSSDFSASEDPSYTSVGATGPVGPSSLVKESPSCYDQGRQLVQQQLLHCCDDSGPTANSSSVGPGSPRPYQFSFADKRPESGGPPQEDIRSYIKNFERGTERDADVEATCSYYDAREYSLLGYTESALIDRVVYKSRIESGGLLLCGGAISCLPFASLL